MTAKSKPGDALVLAGILALVVIIFTAVIWISRGDLLLTIIFALSLLATIVLITIYLIKRERRYVLASGIEELENMGGRHFAFFLQELFKGQGYFLEEKVVVNDHSIDLILGRAGKRVVVQARNRLDSAGIEVIEEAVAALQRYHAHNGIIVTNTYLTADAIEAARAHGLELWDRDRLSEEIPRLRLQSIQ